mgnify:CR=1 FL=1
MITSSLFKCISINLKSESVETVIPCIVIQSVQGSVTLLPYPGGIRSSPNSHNNPKTKIKCESQPEMTDRYVKIIHSQYL